MFYLIEKLWACYNEVPWTYRYSGKARYISVTDIYEEQDTKELIVLYQSAPSSTPSASPYIR